jgi:osmotically-inducible protein OsmY
MSARHEEAPQYIAARAHDHLACDDRLATLDVDVRVVGQKVFLSGSVNTDTQRQVAAALMREHLPGYEVHNELQLVEGAEVEAGRAENLT